MLRALDEYDVEGVETLLGFHRALLSHPCFVEGETCYGIVESELLAERAEQLSHQTTNLPASSDGTLRERVSAVELDGRRIEVRALVPEPPYRELARRRRERSAAGSGAAEGAVTTPMQGTVLAVEVGDGETIEGGAVICVVEAMKMENEITAPFGGVVSELAVEPGQAVAAGQVVCRVTA
jgi:acetyl-CoA/propionyl-CoA carboxylase biotin carboxyl carrier protein